ncbi:hypothetical protein B0H66DRAFT_17686 [Apodospora peruviana]|uniref:DUF7791 domain-containing protein n=1 Tax=Apodospora peruviana TaxID=516989 RepID=A0AAE0MEA5_9PEZI|nr:hypothetical protein B0H66DRAFT_17686 [Apodospora peruviana]
MVDLRRRLHALSTDLEEFFKRIIFIVDDLYRQRTAHIFQVTIEASMTQPLMLYWFMDQDPEYSLKLPIQPFSMQATNIRLKQTQKRLNACCKGLLEVQFYASTDAAAESSLSSSVLFNWKVDFLHRTARDFLQTDAMQTQLKQWAGPNFNVDFIISNAITAQVKTAPQEEEYFRPGGSVHKPQLAFREQLGNCAEEYGHGTLPYSLSVELKRAFAQQYINVGISTVEPESPELEDDSAEAKSVFQGFKLWRFW